MMEKLQLPEFNVSEQSSKKIVVCTSNCKNSRSRIGNTAVRYQICVICITVSQDNAKKSFKREKGDTFNKKNPNINDCETKYSVWLSLEVIE